MWEIWANYLLPKALKTCPKSNKLPNLVTLLQPYRSQPTVFFSEVFFEKDDNKQKEVHSSKESFLQNTKFVKVDSDDMISVTRLGDILDFGQIFKAFGNK